MTRVVAGQKVVVAPGAGRKWVRAASLRGDARADRVTSSRVHVAYWTGGGRAVSTWLPLDAVEPFEGTARHSLDRHLVDDHGWTEVDVAAAKLLTYDELEERHDREHAERSTR